MLRKLKALFPHDHPLRLFWHRVKSFLACVVYRYTANKMTIIGITGTNGKTTTVTLTAKILEKAGYKVGMASTTSFKIDRKEWQNTSHKTTLGPFHLQRLLRRMVKAGCTHAVIETSSHALAQHRVAGISYDVVAITNVTPEHLDYHKSMKAYRQDKMKLFEELSSQKRKEGVKKISVHNTDDRENFAEFMKFEADEKIGYGLKSSAPEGISKQVWADEIEYRNDSSTLTLHTPDEKLIVKTHLPGDFNIENVLAATAIGYALDAKLEAVKEALKEVKLIPGRMEAIEEGQDYKVFVDFAMTEDGYEKLLSSLRKVTDGRLWVVFGCCGDRDQKKRPRIGEICGEMADKVVVCDDEPYTEDPVHIREMILEGVRNTKMKEGEDCFEIPDRQEAIRFACSKAKSGDTIVIPGMGDLEGRTFADGIRPWNEREEVRGILKELQGSVASTTAE